MPVSNRTRWSAPSGKALLAAACAAGMMLAASDGAQAHKRGGGGDSKKPPYQQTGDGRVPIPPVVQPPVVRPQGGVVRDHRTRPTPVVRDHRAGAPVVRDHRATPAMPVYRAGRVTRAVTGPSGVSRAVTRAGGDGVRAIPRKKADCGTACKTKRTVAGVGQTFKNGGRAIGKKIRDIF